LGKGLRVEIGGGKVTDKKAPSDRKKKKNITNVKNKTWDKTSLLLTRGYPSGQGGKRVASWDGKRS